MTENELTFVNLIEAIQQVHKQLASQAGRAVNISLTLRNWLIGCYIAEYELNGADRADYGEMLMDKLAETLGNNGVSRSDVRELRRYRQFYSTYPQIRETLNPELLLRSSAIFKLPVSSSLSNSGDNVSRIVGTVSAQFKMQAVGLINKLII
jgi:hypothetical protein